MKLLFVLFAVFSLSLSYEVENSPDISVMNIEHAFTSNDAVIWTTKANLNIKSINSNSITISNENSLTNDEKENLRKSLEFSGYYKLRIISPNGESIETSVKTCHLVASNFKSDLQVSVDGFGNVIGIFISTNDQQCHFNDIDFGNNVDIKTTVYLQSPVVGVSPNISDYLKKLEFQEREKLKSEQGDNRSFLSKYWFYLLPIFIMLLMTSMSQDNSAR